MKKIYLIFGLIILSSCSNSQDDSEILTDGGTKYSVIVIDGCQYLKRTSGYSGFQSHKGNCYNPIHPYNAIPKEETVEELYRKIDSMSILINSY